MATDQHHNREESTMNGNTIWTEGEGWHEPRPSTTTLVNGRIRTEVGDPVRAAQAADLGAIVTDRAGEEGWRCEAVAAGAAIPAFRTVDSIVGALATQREQWATTHALKDANPRERRIVRGQS